MEIKQTKLLNDQQKLLNRLRVQDTTSSSVKAFVESLEEISGMYQKEESIKREIIRDLQITLRERDTLLLYLSCWSLQPFLDSNRLLYLDNILSHQTVKHCGNLESEGVISTTAPRE